MPTKMGMCLSLSFSFSLVHLKESEQSDNCPDWLSDVVCLHRKIPVAILRIPMHSLFHCVSMKKVKTKARRQSNMHIHAN